MKIKVVVAVSQVGAGKQIKIKLETKEKITADLLKPEKRRVVGGLNNFAALTKPCFARNCFTRS